MRELRAGRIGLVHLNELGWNYDLAIACYLARVPLVLSIHLAAVLHPRNWHWRIARRVVLVSEEQRRTITGFERIAHKAVVIHNPVDLEGLARGASLRRELGIAGHAAVVGVVGQIRSGKRTHLFLDTAEWLITRETAVGTDLVFLIVGRAGVGEEGYARAIAQRVAASPLLASRVHLLGSRRDIPDLLATMDVFFLPTEIETLSVATVEAMAAGRPVVTTSVGGMGELFPTPDLGTVVHEPTPEAFGSAILRYLATPEHAAATGRRAQLSLVGRFDRSTVRRQLDELYGAAR
jgi:glycosyltransferase involved in cell wall biosynthesis